MEPEPEREQMEPAEEQMEQEREQTEPERKRLEPERERLEQGPQKRAAEFPDAANATDTVRETRATLRFVA